MSLSAASASMVSAASTTSPSGRDSPAIAPGESPAGNDSTLVEESLPRQARFSARISASSVKTMVASQVSCRTGDEAAKAARAARTSASSPTATRSQISAWRATSTSSDDKVGLGPGSAMALTPLGRRLIGVDDLADQLAADHVAAGEGDMGDIVDAFENGDGFEQPRILAGRQIDLRRIAGDDHLAALAEPREEHLHLHRRGVLCLIENDHGVRERAAAHEGKRSDLDHAGGEAALDPLRRQHIVKRIVERAQIRIDLLAHVARQEAEALAGLDGGTRQDQPVAFAVFQA